MNASTVHPLHLRGATGPRDSLLRQACQEPMATGGKVLIRCDLIERSGSSEAWYGGRARRSVGQRIPGNTPPSLAPPRARLATRLPGTHCSSDCSGCALRTVMNNPGLLPVTALSRLPINFVGGPLIGPPYPSIS